MDKLVHSSLELRHFTFKMVPFGFLLVRRFAIWFPIVSLCCQLLLQTQMTITCSHSNNADEDFSDDDSDTNNFSAPNVQELMNL
ncbi:Hypothetical protein NTJ_07242 [Nesidiocoris tenuis]|uniref:Uncharacterized protein n=1 Tax=Nesidiocoris tenuis TaxID=355587 RepID=A0ABN7AR69_9HEMI|nr:Hypothetical protein NTJ_07242 [Nesidiocoris tenuis]